MTLLIVLIVLLVLAVGVIVALPAYYLNRDGGRTTPEALGIAMKSFAATVTLQIGVLGLIILLGTLPSPSKSGTTPSPFQSSP